MNNSYSLEDFFFLIIEDDFINQVVLKKKLKVFNNDIDVASNGKEGLNILSNYKKKPVIIFLDLNMPVMDGYDFINEFTEIKETFTFVRIIVVSGIIYEEFQKSNLTDKIFSFIPKPIDKELLIETVIKASIS